MYIVGRHQRNRANVEVPCAGPCDFEGSFVGIGIRSKTERELLVRIRKCGNGNGLAIALAISQDQTHLYRRAWRASQINPTYILLAINQCQTGLPNAMRRGHGKVNAWTLIADEGILFVHEDDFVRSRLGAISEAVYQETRRPAALESRAPWMRSENRTSGHRASRTRGSDK